MGRGGRIGWGGAATILALAVMCGFACATRPHVEDEPTFHAVPSEGAGGQEAPTPSRPTHPPPPPEKVWAHSFVTALSPPWSAMAGDAGRAIVVPIVSGEVPPEVMEVGLQCAFLSWSASGDISFVVEVSGYPDAQTGSLARGLLRMSIGPRRSSLTDDRLLTTEVPVPKGVDAITVRFTRDAKSDTFNQDPVVRALRVSY